MKILVVSQYFWPDNFLINEICEEFIKKGHAVTVLTGLPDYSTTKIPSKYKYFKNRIEEHNGIRIIRVPTIARRRGFFFRTLNYISFYICGKIYALTHKIDCDVIYSYQTAPALMIEPARVFKKKLKKPLFIYVLDIWPDQMKVWGVGEKNPLFRIVLRYCIKAYNSGDKIGITSKPFSEYLQKICKVPKEKIIYLPQHSSRMSVSKKRINKKTIELTYAGNIGNQQNLQCFLKAVSVISTNNKYHVSIYGEGTSYADCVNLAKELGISKRVTFFGRVDKEKLAKAYADTDAFVLTLCSEKEIGFAANTVPAKLQGYMSTGKPILASIDGGGRDVINESRCGLAVASGDYVEFSKIIKRFIDNPKHYKALGRNGKEYFDEHYSKEVILTKQEKILNGIL